MTGRIANKVAVVTGGCSGIGLATAELFIAEGARVVVGDILDAEGAALEKKHQGKLHFIHCDVTREQDIAATIALAVKEFGGLDITFNNAGAMGTMDKIVDMQIEKWDHTLNLLLRSVMLGIKHSIAPMKARGGGAIVNTASVSGMTTNGPAAYCTSKAAVIQLTRMAAMELAADRIRVNSVLPGLIATSIFGAGMGMTHDQSVKMADEMKKGMSAAQPLPKPGLPRDIAEAVLYLVSDASAFVTGTEIRVDGGIAIQPFMGDEQQAGTVSNLIATSAQKVTA